MHQATPPHCSWRAAQANALCQLEDRRCCGWRRAGHPPDCNAGSFAVEAQKTKQASEGEPCPTCHLYIIFRQWSDSFWCDHGAFICCSAHAFNPTCCHVSTVLQEVMAVNTWRQESRQPADPHHVCTEVPGHSHKLPAGIMVHQHTVVGDAADYL